jgi:hypothetical protein
MIGSERKGPMGWVGVCPWVLVVVVVVLLAVADEEG